MEKPADMFKLMKTAMTSFLKDRGPKVSISLVIHGPCLIEQNRGNS